MSSGMSGSTGENSHLSLMLRLLSASVCAANRSGIIIREILKTGELGIVQKGVNDPQTEADRRAQRCIAATLQSRFPEINLIGEEDVKIEEDDYKLVGSDEECSDVLKEVCPSNLTNLKENELIVWVDPLDGTKEFTEGFPEHVTVLIGVSYKNRPVGGVIHQPFHGPNGRTMWGLIGLGVRGLNCVQPLGNGKLKDDLRIVVTRSHMNPIVKAAVDALQPKEVLHVGGSGNKILMVLEGSADAYVYASLGTKKWDTCAGEALLLAAGGTLTDVHGHLLSYDGSPDNIMNSKGVIVTMGCHDELIAKIPEHVKEKFRD